MVRIKIKCYTLNTDEKLKGNRGPLADLNPAASALRIVNANSFFET